MNFLMTGWSGLGILSPKTAQKFIFYNKFNLDCRCRDRCRGAGISWLSRNDLASIWPLKKKFSCMNSHLVVLNMAVFMLDYRWGQEKGAQVRWSDGRLAVHLFSGHDVFGDSVSGVVLRGIEPNSAGSVIKSRELYGRGSIKKTSLPIWRTKKRGKLPGIIIVANWRAY